MEFFNCDAISPNKSYLVLNNDKMLQQSNVIIFFLFSYF